MKIVPYLSVSGVPFGATREQVSALLGRPPKIESGAGKERVEFHYPSLIIRFDSEFYSVVEVTVDSEYLEIENCFMSFNKQKEVAFVELGYVIAKLDSDSFSTVGFFVSPFFVPDKSVAKDV